MSPLWAERTGEMGVYLDVFVGGMRTASGATGVIPLDPLSGNAGALEEYRAYRDRVGPPPGTLGMPAFQVVDVRPRA